MVNFCVCLQGHQEKPVDPDLALLEAIKLAREAAKERKAKELLEEAKEAEDKERECKEFDQEALNGVSFIKHGRQGKPHARVVCVRGKLIDWGTGSIDFEEVIQIVAGKQCEVIREIGEIVAPSALCFSILTKTRSLALQAISVEQRDKWIAGLTRLWKQWQGATMIRNPLNEELAHLKSDTKELLTPTSKLTHSAPISPQSIAASPIKPAPFVDPAIIEYEQFLKSAELGITFVLHVKGETASQKQVLINRKSNEIVFVVGSIKLSEVTDICAGKVTEAFSNISDDLSPPQLCFSIITPRRTVDLQADDVETMELWFNGLRKWWGSINENFGKELASSGIDKSEANDPVRLLAKQHLEDKKIKSFLEKGCQFLKYGKLGAPHLRNVFVDFARAEVNYTSGIIPLIEIVKAVSGKESSIFKGTKEKETPEMLCFSIIARKRSLDLQCSSQIMRDMWVKGISRLIEEFKQGKIANFGI